MLFLNKFKKISEVDESDEIIMSRSTTRATTSKNQSRPQTNKAPIQKSQATLIGSSGKQQGYKI